MATQIWFDDSGYKAEYKYIRSKIFFLEEQIISIIIGNPL